MLGYNWIWRTKIKKCAWCLSLVTSNLYGDFSPDNTIFVIWQVWKSSICAASKPHNSYDSFSVPVVKSTAWLSHQSQASVLPHGSQQLDNLIPSTSPRTVRACVSAAWVHGSKCLVWIPMWEMSRRALKVRKDIYCKINFSLSWR